MNHSAQLSTFATAIEKTGQTPKKITNDLEAENARLRAEVADLKLTVSALRAMVAKP